MPDYRSFYEKDYLGAWNIPESGELTVTIVKCVQGELNNPGTSKKTKKPVVYVKETEKGFALNATNGKTIAALYGNKTEAWPGKRITLYKSMTRNPSGGDDVECLRVRPKVPASGAQSQPKTAATKDADQSEFRENATSHSSSAAAPSDDDLVASIKTLVRSKEFDEAYDLARSISDEATRIEAVAVIDSRKAKAA